MNKTFKNIVALVALALVAFCVIIYTSQYSSLQTEIENMEFEIDLLEASIANYDVADADTDASTDSEFVDFEAYPVDLQEQDQIDFFLELSENSHVELSQISMGDSSSVGSTGGYTVMQKTMTFKYLVDSYDEFLAFFEEIQSNENYPSSIENFTMSVGSDSSVSGQIELNNYYITDSSIERSYELDSSVEIGASGLMGYE